MKSFFFSIFLIVSSLSLFAQLNLTVSSSKMPVYTHDGDTLSVCRDSMLILKAIVKDGADTLKNVYFNWNFDDETVSEGTDLDSVTHIFVKGGGYRIKIFIKTEDNRTLNWILPVRINLPANFSKIKTDIPEEHDGVCKGSQVLLTGKAFPEKWEDVPVYEFVEPTPKRFDDLHVYESVLSFYEFPNDSVFHAGFLDSVSLNLEHSDVGNLKIELICPDGISMIIKDLDSNIHSAFALPVNDEALPDNVGTGLDYHFTDSAFGLLPVLADNETIPAGQFLSQDNFSVLNGCKLNGDWKLRITDNVLQDNGFVFSWALTFNDSILPPVWTFTDSVARSSNRGNDFYVLNTFWIRPNSTEIAGTGVQFSGDTIVGISEAYPDAYGNVAYEFHVINNWACPQDTTYNIKVEKPSFTATPSSGNAELDVDLVNTTTWAAEQKWDLGDKSPKLEEPSFSHLYKEKGDYKVLLKVTDADECEDTISVTIKVSIEPSSVENSQNVFSPNEDGMNDFFKVTVKGMETFRISIYNRWGELMYQTENEDEITDTGWNGRTPIANLRASPGVYFYVIKGKGKDGIEYEEKGTVTLFR